MGVVPSLCRERLQHWPLALLGARSPRSPAVTLRPADISNRVAENLDTDAKLLGRPNERKNRAQQESEDHVTRESAAAPNLARGGSGGAPDVAAHVRLVVVPALDRDLGEGASSAIRMSPTRHERSSRPWLSADIVQPTIPRLPSAARPRARRSSYLAPWDSPRISP